jgi:hypothetical protein
VSRCNRKLCDGVPNVPLAKYNVSCQLSALNCQPDLSAHTSFCNDA